MMIRPSMVADLDEIRVMLREYAAWLEVDLCFQNFEEELAGLPGEYAPPLGRLLRGSGVGRRLVLAIIEEARRIGYRRVRLDTMPKMDRAQGLYAALGFRGIGAYRYNPEPGARFLELEI